MTTEGNESLSLTITHSENGHNYKELLHVIVRELSLPDSSDIHTTRRDRT